MLFQLVEEKHNDWKEHHPSSEIEFEVKGSTQESTGKEPSISLEVTPAGMNESKDWNIYPINSDDCEV